MSANLHLEGAGRNSPWRAALCQAIQAGSKVSVQLAFLHTNACTAIWFRRMATRLLCPASVAAISRRQRGDPVCAADLLVDVLDEIVTGLSKSETTGGHDGSLSSNTTRTCRPGRAQPVAYLHQSGNWQLMRIRPQQFTVRNLGPVLGAAAYRLTPNGGRRPSLLVIPGPGTTIGGEAWLNYWPTPRVLPAASHALSALGTAQAIVRTETRSAAPTREDTNDR